MPHRDRMTFREEFRATGYSLEELYVHELNQRLIEYERAEADRRKWRHLLDPSRTPRLPAPPARSPRTRWLERFLRPRPATVWDIPI